MDLKDRDDYGEIGLRDEIRMLRRDLSKTKKERKPKNFRLPTKAWMSSLAVKKGYILVCKFDENQNVMFRKYPIEDGTIRIVDRSGTSYHAVQEKDIFLYKGKKPMIIIAKNKVNPYNPIAGLNETYGQEYIMAKMMKDAIKPKRKINGMLIFILIIVGIGAYYLFSKGGFGG